VEGLEVVMIPVVVVVLVNSYSSVVIHFPVPIP
jgi:hypothetical protein